jgi:hypothetical protein
MIVSRGATKITSFDPPLLTVLASYPSEPLQAWPARSLTHQSSWPPGDQVAISTWIGGSTSRRSASACCCCEVGLLWPPDHEDNRHHAQALEVPLATPYLGGSRKPGDWRALPSLRALQGVSRQRDLTLGW